MNVPAVVRPRYWQPIIVSFAAALLAAAPARCDDLKASEARQDPRLEKRVTIAEPRVCLGDLLEKLAAQTGVSLSAGDRGDDAGDPEVTAFVTGARLRDLMSAVWSLVSHRGAEWHWHREGKPGAYRYQLQRPAPARTFAARFRQHVRERFEGEVATLLAAVNAPPDRAATIAATDPAAARAFRNAMTRAGLRAFSLAFPPELQLRILRGDAAPQVSVGDLSSDARASVHLAFVQVNQLNQGRLTEPVSISAGVHPSSDQLAPMLIMGIGGPGAYSYAGGRPLEEEFEKELDRLWMLPGDENDDPASARAFRPPEEHAPEKPELLPSQRRVRDMSHDAPLSVVALLPRRENIRSEYPPPPPPKTVAEVLKKLRDEPPYLRAKWRHGVLALNYPGSILDEEEYVPWPMVRRLRAAEKREGWEPSLDEMGAASTLTEKQVQRLADAFGYMGAVVKWQGLFRVYHQFPDAAAQLVSEAGLPVTGLLPAFQRVPDPSLLKLIESGDVAAVRFVTERQPGPQSTLWTLWLELVHTDGQAQKSSGTSYPLPRQHKAEQPGGR
jgi:hypothetical protein